MLHLAGNTGQHKLALHSNWGGVPAGTIRLSTGTEGPTLKHTHHLSGSSHQQQPAVPLLHFGTPTCPALHVRGGERRPLEDNLISNSQALSPTRPPPVHLQDCHPPKAVCSRWFSPRFFTNMRSMIGECDDHRHSSSPATQGQNQAKIIVLC